GRHAVRLAAAEEWVNHEAHPLAAGDLKTRKVQVTQSNAHRCLVLALLAGLQQPTQLLLKRLFKQAGLGDDAAEQPGGRNIKRGVEGLYALRCDALVADKQHLVGIAELDGNVVAAAA